MKWIKYQIVCGKNENGENILLNKKVGYSAENLAIAEKEAYDGYEIIEDGESFDKEPLAIELGGTKASDAKTARENLGAFAAEDYDGLIVERDNFAQAKLKAGRGISVTTILEPAQAGSGDPYPAGTGKNKFCATKDDTTDLNGLTVTAIAGSSELNFNGTVAGSNTGATIATSIEIPAGTYTISVLGLKNGDYLNGSVLGGASGAYVFLNLNDSNPKTFTINETINLKISCVGVANKDAYSNVSVKIQIEPGTEATEYTPHENIRPITGWDALNLHHAGKNLVPWPYVMGGFGTVYERNGLTAVVNDDYSVTVNGTATGSVYLHICNMDLGSEAIIPGGTNGIYALSERVRYNANTGVVSINFAAGNVVNNKTFYPQVELGTVATEFEPPRGELHTVQFGQTVYGGKFDWLTGELTAEWEVYTFDGTEGWSLNKAHQFGLTRSYNTTSFGQSYCSHFKGSERAAYDASENNTITVNRNAIWIYSENFATAGELKEFIANQYAAGTPVQVAYKLAEPIEIQLTAIGIIEALEGVNTIYGDGDVEATFNHDLNLLKVVPTPTFVYSEEEVKTEETWIDGKPIYRRVVSYDACAVNDVEYTSEVVCDVIDTVVRFDGALHRPDGKVFQLSFYKSSTAYLYTQVLATHQFCTVGVKSMAGTVIAWMDYTKTTD